jgi:unsaturated rhamnogalacturonyl hydrolase
MLQSLLEVCQLTGDQKYFDYVKQNMDHFILPDGTIKGYSLEEYNIDHINAGKGLFPLYRATGDERYKKAADLLRSQLRTHPRTAEGGFWHKKIYTQQMWLDGIYMGSPFLAEYGTTFNEPAALDDVVHQITLIDSHTRDPKTNLLYHGWDSVKAQGWADPKTGASPNFWGRSIGWYLMALVDVLDVLDHPRRDEIMTLVKKTVDGVLSVQDADSGVWYQVMDQGSRPGNYLEASASCMFTYSILKAVRKGYLSTQYLERARKAYQGILKQFIVVDDQGLVDLTRICYVAGLGGDPYRDASFECYINEKIVTNDFKGIGPFILASVENECLP